MRRPVLAAGFHAYYVVMRIMRLTRWTSLIFMILTLGACASRSPRADLERVHEGTDKARVLEYAGNPKRTYHQKGLDHWVYVFYENERELFQTISFRDQIVVKVGPVTGKASLNSRLENAESMEDYEKTVKEHQKKTGEFRDVPEDGKL